MATRKPLKMRQDKQGRMWAVYFLHPVKKRSTRIPLGLGQAAAETRLAFLNQIFLFPQNWHVRPEKIPVDIWDLWAGVRVLSEPEKDNAASAALGAMADRDYWRDEYFKLEAVAKKMRAELEMYRGKAREGPCPTLQAALSTWIENYEGRDADWTKTVHNDLKAFVKRFGPEKECDELIGREKWLVGWLESLQCGASRLAQIRTMVIKFLTDSGVRIDRKLIPAPGKAAKQRDRGGIRWLERSEALAVTKALESPWNDYFSVQVALGFRADELLTLKRADFHGEKFETVTLSPLKHLTLKLGPRTLQVPETIRPILKRRFDAGDVLFPDPATGEPWQKPKLYNRKYNAALKLAGTAAGVRFVMDCRVARRTCASLLLRSGVSIERVAALLGDDAETIKSHYGSILSHEVDATAAALDPLASRLPAEKAGEEMSVDYFNRGSK